MCNQCNYQNLMKETGLGSTPNRLNVLEVIGNHNGPVSATEIHDALCRHQPINRVTVYRILDLLVEKGLIERISGGGRAFYYGMAPNEHHAPHPHFYCTQCGQMECLSPRSFQMDASRLKRTFSGRVQRVAIRFDGVCSTCLQSQGDMA